MEAQCNRWLAPGTHRRVPRRAAGKLGFGNGFGWRPHWLHSNGDAHSSQWCAGNEHLGILSDEATSSFPLPASTTSHIAMCRRVSKQRHFTRLSLRGTLPGFTSYLLQNEGLSRSTPRSTRDSSPHAVRLPQQSPGDLQPGIKIKLWLTNAGG